MRREAELNLAAKPAEQEQNRAPQQGAAAAPASRVSPGWYSYPWPDALLGLGRRSTGPFDKCCRCSAWSWVRYGGVVFCVRCAVREAAIDEASNRENSH